MGPGSVRNFTSAIISYEQTPTLCLRSSLKSDVSHFVFVTSAETFVRHPECLMKTMIKFVPRVTNTNILNTRCYCIRENFVLVKVAGFTIYACHTRKIICIRENSSLLYQIETVKIRPTQPALGRRSCIDSPV